MEGIKRLYVLKGPPSDATSYAESLHLVNKLFGERGDKDETEKLKVRASEPPVIKLVNSIVHGAIEELASDIHIEPHEEGFDIRYRVDGLLYKIDGPPKDMYPPVVSRIKIMSRLDIAEKRLPQDGGFMIMMDNRSVDFRVSTIPTIYGEKIVIRILDKEKTNFSLSSIGMSKDNYLKVSAAIKKPYGLIFLTGPTGSGKTTTLYCMLNEIKSPQKNIITIEDPVEYRVSGVNQVQELPNIGLTFARGLRAFLRQDPDVIMVGEVRDLETAEMCVRSALIGRLVLSTLHTNDSIGAITRLIDFGIEPFLISSSLIMVIAQRLIRRLCPKCKELITVDKAIIEKYSLERAKLYGPKGCKECRKRGFSGRLAIFEILIADTEIKDMIEGKRDTAAIREALEKKGMKFLRYDAMDKVRQGLTSLDEAIIATTEIF
jgi:type II secretory ATPase GspE/PulE/Tfp pilus assembly ATPase PilB-like protein